MKYILVFAFIALIAISNYFAWIEKDFTRGCYFMLYALWARTIITELENETNKTP